MSDKPIDVEATSEPTQALAIRQEGDVAPAGLFGVSEPVAIIERATSVATALKSVITKQGLISKISGKEYPKCEAWTLLGTMLGVFPVLCWTKQVEGGWEARVEAKTRDGAIVGAAEAQCLHSERNWKDRDDFALRSMAQTRATAKCLRMPLGFVMTLAGYEPTPAEEMVADHPQPPPGRAAAPPTQRPAQPQPAAPTPSQVSTKPLPKPFPTSESRSKMIAALKAGIDAPNRDIVTEYFRKLTNPTPLAPFEVLEDLPLRFVPATTGQMKALSEKLTEFGNGERAVAAFPPHPEPDPRKAGAKAKPIEVPRDPPGPAAPDPATTGEPWREIICPIPRKGMKRDEYLRNPDTIGSLYDLRHGNDDEAQAARQRLWGFVEHYEPKPWVKNNGEEVPPSAADVKFREALDQFAAWFEREHPDEKL